MANKTKIIVGAVFAILLTVAAGCGKKQEAYRSIMVYQVNGNATITRDKVGAMDAYENLMLVSGDIVEVPQDSNVRLKLDNDKYLLAESDTVICIKAEGDADNSKTYIDLQKGAVTNEIQNKLGSGSSYEVNTPNSIMAVRGTVFRVALGQTENGEYETKIDVFDGAVKVNPVAADGTVMDAEIAVEAGKETIVGPKQVESGQLDEPVDIDYENLPPVMQVYLTELAQKEQALPANVIQHVQEAQQSESWSKGGESKSNASSDSGDSRHDTEFQNDGEETKKEGIPAPEEQRGQEDAQDNQQNGQQDILGEEIKNSDDEQVQEPKIEDRQNQDEEVQKQQEELQKQQEEVQKQQEEILRQQDEIQRQLKQQEELKKKQEEAQKQQQNNPQNPSSGGENNSGGGGGSGGGGSSKTTYYTVTFTYNGGVFGTQQVKSGTTAAVPTLNPTLNGRWNYDFAQKVSKNISIDWIAE